MQGGRRARRCYGVGVRTVHRPARAAGAPCAPDRNASAPSSGALQPRCRGSASVGPARRRATPGRHDAGSPSSGSPEIAPAGRPTTEGRRLRDPRGGDRRGLGRPARGVDLRRAANHTRYAWRNLKGPPLLGTVWGDAGRDGRRCRSRDPTRADPRRVAVGINWTLARDPDRDDRAAPYRKIRDRFAPGRGRRRVAARADGAAQYATCGRLPAPSASTAPRRIGGARAKLCRPTKYEPRCVISLPRGVTAPVARSRAAARAPAATTRDRRLAPGHTDSMSRRAGSYVGRVAAHGVACGARASTGCRWTRRDRSSPLGAGVRCDGPLQNRRGGVKRRADRAVRRLARACGRSRRARMPPRAPHGRCIGPQDSSVVVAVPARAPLLAQRGRGDGRGYRGPKALACSRWRRTSSEGPDNDAPTGPDTLDRQTHRCATRRDPWRLRGSPDLRRRPRVPVQRRGPYGLKSRRSRVTARAQCYGWVRGDNRPMSGARAPSAPWQIDERACWRPTWGKTTDIMPVPPVVARAPRRSRGTARRTTTPTSQMVTELRSRVDSRALAQRLGRPRKHQPLGERRYA